MELPASFGLKTEERSDGKLNIVGKDDAGEKYVARVTSGPEVSNEDVAALANGDRERNNPWDFTHDVMNANASGRKAWEDNMLNEFMEPAEVVAHAGLHRGGSTTGSTAAYRRNYDKVFGGQ